MTKSDKITRYADEVISILKEIGLSKKEKTYIKDMDNTDMDIL